MKLTRRSFMKIVAALIPTGPVAAYPGDIDFLPPEREVVPEVKEPPRVVVATPPQHWTGELRYNSVTKKFEVYYNQGWKSYD